MAGPTLAFSDIRGVINASTLTSAAFTPSAGDVLVVKTGTWWNATSPGTPSDTSGQTWTRRAQETGGTNNGPVEIWTAVVGEAGAPSSPGSITVSITPAASSHHTLLVERWTGAQLAAAPANGNTRASSSGAASCSITTAADDSVVTWVLYDGNSTDPATRAYRSSATEEALSDQHVGANGVFYFAYQAAPTAGSQTFGLTAPNTFYALAGIEIQAAVDPADADAGVLAGTTPAPTGALAGSVVDSGALAGTTPAPSGALTSSTSAPGVLAGVTRAPSAILAGAVQTAGVLDGATRAPHGTLTDVVPVVEVLGSWEQLRGVMRSIRADTPRVLALDAPATRTDCPRCGTNLESARGGGRRCPFDGWSSSR
jgi:hypothetical protein